MAKQISRYRFSGRKVEGRRSFGRRRRRWAAIFKIDLTYDGKEYRIYLALDKDK
jgi:hypothetical protein